MSVAVIIPVLNEQESLPKLFSNLQSLRCDEIILVDGHSQDETVDMARRYIEKSLACISCQILSTPRGRARQMNAGAKEAKSDILLFLHADTVLPPDAIDLVTRALSSPARVGGRFDVRFPDDRGYAWVVSRMMNHRSRWSGICTGDQAMFVRRRVFEVMGGFKDLPLMEDLDFSRRLKRQGSIVALRETVTTSFRRWEQQGPLRTILQMWTLRFLYWIGWDPHRLQQFYHHVR